jgi:hypothetical protein
MPDNTQKIIYILYLMIISLFLHACEKDISTSISLPTATRDIFPYQTSKAVSPSPTQGLTTPIPRTPDPTSTPFVHTIVKGDTLLGIALRYGVDVEDLQASNPDIDPNMLSVGSHVIIPLGDDVQSSVMTPTPIPIASGKTGPAIKPAMELGVLSLLRILFLMRWRIYQLKSEYIHSKVI